MSANPKSLNIRPAGSNDLDLLANFNFQLIKDERHSNPMSVIKLKQRMSNWLAREYSAMLIEVANHIAGYVLWRQEDDHLYRRQFFIVPELRRHGIGKDVILALKNSHWKGKKLRLEVLINNVGARKFWQPTGFNEYSLTLECTNSQ